MPEPKKILWIEAQPELEVNKLIKELHDSFNILILLVSNDEDATVALRNSKFDLIITALRMFPTGGESIVNTKTSPREVGIELFKHLRAGDFKAGTRKDVPAIVVSAICDSTTKNKIMSINPAPVAYFEKPVSLSDLKKVVGKVLVDYYSFLGECI